jgi:hypothetical protein
VVADTVDTGSGMPGMSHVLDPATEAVAAAGDAAAAGKAAVAEEEGEAEGADAAVAAAGASAATAAAIQQESSAGVGDEIGDVDGIDDGVGDGADGAGSAPTFADLQQAFPDSVGVVVLWSVALQVHGPEAQAAEVQVAPVLQLWGDADTLQALRSSIAAADMIYLQHTLKVRNIGLSNRDTAGRFHTACVGRRCGQLKSSTHGANLTLTVCLHGVLPRQPTTRQADA